MSATEVQGQKSPRNVHSKLKPRWSKAGLLAGLAFELCLLTPLGSRAAIEVDTLAGGPLVLGGPNFGFVDGNSLEESQFHTPFGCALDNAGILYVADRDNGAIRKLDVKANLTRTLVKDLSQPVAVALDIDGNLRVVCQGDATVKTFDRFGNLLQSIGGFTQPTAVAADLELGNVYVTELGGAVKRIAPDGAVSPVSNGFKNPRGIVVLDSRTLALTEDHAVRRLDLLSLQAEFLAGTNAPGYIDGAGFRARFNQPHHLVRAPNGDLLVADRHNHSVRAVDANGLTITLYGIRSNLWSSDFPGWADGSVELAEAREPVGIAAARDGRVFTTEVFYHIVRTVAVPLVEDSTNSVSTAVITPPGALTNNPVVVTLSSDTQGAELWYRLVTNTNDVSLPAPGGKDSILYDGPFLLDRTGALFVRGFKSGFLSSHIARADFQFFVAEPKILPKGAASNNPVQITLSTDTAGAQLRWTIDGSEPTTNSPLYLGPFLLGTHGALKVKGFRNGFTPSPTVSADFRLTVATPEVSPASGTFINSLTVSMRSATTAAALRFTLDGSEPTPTSQLYAGPLELRTNATLTVAGFLDGFVTSPTVTREFRVRVDTPTMTPDQGFFPSGTIVSLSVQRPDATIYYTTTGLDPTPNDQPYTGPFNVFSPAGDLRSFRARAFAPNAEPSEVVSGRAVGLNSIGVPRDLVAGIGATVVVPVIANLTTNDVLRTVQFRVEVAPGATAPALEHDLRVLDLSANDFIGVALPTEAGGATRISHTPYSLGGVRGVSISAVGTNANFVVRDFATVALLAVTIPPTAKVNDTYTIDLLQASGTADGQQKIVPLTTLPRRSITVLNVPYVVGDTALGIFYNAGDFGDGELDNSDVNNAFYASLGVRTPFSFTDVFNAMDVFPEDLTGLAGGDGQIRYLDWQWILRRSLRRDTNNWQRAWSDGGTRRPQRANLPQAQGLRPAITLTALPGNVWYRQALLGADAFSNAQPGSVVGVPVYVNLIPGAALAGLQFRAYVMAENGAPALEGAVEFVPAVGTPTPRALAGLPLNEVAVAWDVGGFNPSLVDSNVIGSLRFRVPLSAGPGASYAISFAFADGSPDENTQYDFETRRSWVYVLTPAPTSPDPITDEWRIRFFGRVENPLAAPGEDPDGDGFSNLAEYVAGTHPVDATSRLQLLAPEARVVADQLSVAVRWLSAPGKTYTVEVTDDLINPSWKPLAERHPGDGQVTEVLDLNPSPQQQFYRLRLAP
jgi:hypothetical protein